MTQRQERETAEQDPATLLHDLNQPLTAINNYAQAGKQFIDRGMEDPARLRELFEKISQQAERSMRISQALKHALAARNGVQ